jgi:two-component sensor histidine kinase
VRVTTETFSTRIETQGDEIVIAGRDAQNIALAFELATNAAKYGWQECGGPLTTTPRRKGFGTTLLSTVFSEASLEYAPDGLSCQFSLSIAPPLAKHFDEARLPGF